MVFLHSDVMANRYLQRYYDNHRFKRVDVVTPLSVAHSNSMYDKSKGLTHTFIHTNKGGKDDNVRLIGDVEICMSSDPSVTSEFSPMYRSQLRNGLVNSKGAGSTGLSDEQLMDSIPCNVKFEREDAEAISRQSLDRLSASIESSKKFSEIQSPKDIQTPSADVSSSDTSTAS